jgi:simple sugar transport system ATP-binding protein
LYFPSLSDNQRVNATMPTGALDAAESPVPSLLSMSKSFGPTKALENVDLVLRRGEVVALLGANGAGKSTLAKIASGVVEPDQGQMLINGRPVRFSSPRSAREHGVVTVDQATDQLGVAGISVARNLVLDELCGGSFSTFAGTREIKKRAAEVAAHIGLDLPLDEDYGAFGPAQRQLIAIARAIGAKASVLILDEPTASLGASEADRLFEVVDRLRANGVAILYISHRMGDIRRLADRVVLLRNGRQVFEQRRPLDLAVAIRHMVGRDLGKALTDRAGGASGEPALRLDQVQLRADSSPFDLEIRAGEIIAVTGALGSGKSNLLGALFGLAKFASGRALLDGVEWRPNGPADAIARGVFLAGEDRWRSSLLPQDTPGGDIAGTIALPHRRKWFPTGVISRRRESVFAQRAIEELGIRCNGPSDTLDLLSGGNQQKVVIGRWQSAPCRIFLADEPFQGVDIGSRRDLIDAISARQGNAATLIATSDVEEAIEAADRIGVMRDHAIVGVHDLRQETSDSLLASLGILEVSESAGAAERPHG